MFKTLLKINVNKQCEILKSLMYITPQPNNIKNLTKALLRLQFLFSNKDNRKKSIKNESHNNRSFCRSGKYL